MTASRSGEGPANDEVTLLYARVHFPNGYGRRLEAEAKPVQVIAESTWFWMLYADGERRWLAVLCGSVGLYERVIELDLSEREHLGDDPARIEAFARSIADHPAHWSARHQPEVLDGEAASAATTRWRAERDG